METKLLPCPFCGDCMRFVFGDIEYVTHIDLDMNCIIDNLIFYLDDWNTRQTDRSEG